MKHSEFYAQVHASQWPLWKDRAHGAIQWKGTNVCMDVRCSCGAYGHIDAEFFYNYECAACGAKYAVDSHVALIPLTAEQAQFVDDGGACAFIRDDSLAGTEE